MKCALYNVPYSASFMDVLAQRVLSAYKDKPLDLGNVLFLVPNRRSVQNLKEAFLRANNLTPFLLPQIVPLYEADEDEIFFENGAVDADLEAAVSNEERLFWFAKKIEEQKFAYGIKEMSYAQSLSLATYLGKLIDDTANQIEDPINQKLSFEGLENIVSAEYSEHWQINLDFLKIVTADWPNELKKRNLIDACLRRNILLQKQVAVWKKNPNMKIVAAGIGLPFNALKGVIKALGEMENAEIYLYGLDKDMPFSSWENLNKSNILSKTHPQYGKKELLEVLNATRADVQNVTEKTNINREKLVSEIMREAKTTDQWQSMKGNQELLAGLKNLSLIETEDNFEEALVIAMIMREVLETPQKTAALVTPDRNLARMVASTLKRFGVEIDDSAGLPLHLSPIGIYLRQILDVLENDFSEASVAALLKNNLLKMGKSGEKIGQEVQAAEYEKRKPCYQDAKETPKQDALDEALRKAFEDLKALYEKDKVPFETLMKTHVALAEKLAKDDTLSGAQNLWRHEDGRQCAAVIARILEKADEVGPIAPKEYAAVLLTLLSLEMVRKPYGTHPRLKILGTIEARFCAYDVMIAGSLNDGVWPKTGAADPFMSRAMKETFGLDGPEKQISQTADDLCAILNAKEVYLTRAKRVDGVPTTKSKYWLRIETVVKALDLKIEDVQDTFYTNLAHKIDRSEKRVQIDPVGPKPPIKARPRKFSASTLKKWIQSPYDIYASKILGLKKLDGLDQKKESKDFGTFVHAVMEKFCKKYPAALDERAESVLRQMFASDLEAAELDSSTKVFWNGMIENFVTWFLENAPAYRADIKNITSEAEGQMVFKGVGGDVILTARADRIDETVDGFYQIGDYKTGRVPQTLDVICGFEPQLPLEGLIASVGGFEKDGKKLPIKPIKHLFYFSPKKGKLKAEDKTEYDLKNILEQTKEHIQEMIDAFDDENTPYLYNPNPQNINEYSDYEQLARFKEWKGRSNEQK